jgi:hypothetical protein
MQDTHRLARKARNFAFINKLVTEIGHTSERKVRGIRKEKEPSWLPLETVSEGKGKPNISIVWPCIFPFSFLRELCDYAEDSACCYWSNELTLKSELKTAP